MTARSVAGFLLLLAAAVGSWYLSASLSRDAEELTVTPALQSGFYLRSARILGTAEDGRLLYEIEAEYAEQIAEDRVEFQDVRIRYTPDADVPWTLNADRAVVTGNQERLTLEGHVIATSSEGFSGDVTEIRTDSLELEPERYLATTDDRVQVRIGSRSVTATGMLALLNENRLELKSNVSGKFVP